MADFLKAVREQEGDRLEFEAHGLPCVIVRAGGFGYLCGYVGIPKGHPLHGTDSWSHGAVGLNVHGGLTCAKSNNPLGTGAKAKGFWWFGFDCAHAGDFVPGLGSDFPTDVYRDMDYVRHECERLAEQLVKAGESS